MIFSCENEVASAGDLVIFFVSPNDISPVHLEEGKILQHRLGKFRHDDMIGKRFGQKVVSIDGQRHVSMLRPTPELWTRSLPHRTQILYLPDISFILRKLNIKPGSVVIESGTGSGSFSHSIFRSLLPNGHLYTFEFHPERAKLAVEEFEKHGMSSLVTVEHRDVVERGFGMVDLADSVFLDLPATWEALKWAKEALKKDGSGRVCCFSPCIEQVLKNFETFRQLEFTDIEMFEVLSRDYEIRSIGSAGSIEAPKTKKAKMDINTNDSCITMPQAEAKGHTSYLTFARLPIIE